MTLTERINNDLKEAMKSKDSFRLGVIRMVKGAMQLAKPNPREELTDDDVIAVISKQIKMRNDSINEFAKAGREDLVEQNKKEIEVLKAMGIEFKCGIEVGKDISLDDLRNEGYEAFYVAIGAQGSRKLNIPVFGLVDTNCDPDDVDYVIPGNDDAVRSVKVVLGALTNAICEAKGLEIVDYVTEDVAYHTGFKETDRRER